MLPSLSPHPREQTGSREAGPVRGPGIATVASPGDYGQMGISNWKLLAERRPASALPSRLCDPGRERHLPGPRAPSVAGETGPARGTAPLGTPQASAAAVPSLPIWTCRLRAVIATRQAAGGMFAQARPGQQAAGATTWEATPSCSRDTLWEPWAQMAPLPSF